MDNKSLLEAEKKILAEEKQILKMGFDSLIVKRVLKSLHQNEYKRRQAAPGLKITPRAFGIGRRYPLARKV